MSDSETLKVYNAQAEEYATLTAEDAKDTLLIQFIAALPAGGHVLDLGCGPGHMAAEMAHAGLNVTATDASQEMVKLANARIGVTAHQSSFDDIEGTNIYDGIWANFSLLHAPREKMPTHLAALAKTLRPGGHFHIALKSGTGAARDRLGRLYTYYEETELLDLLKDAGFHPGNITRGSGTGLDGSVADWIAVHCHG